MQKSSTTTIGTSHFVNYGAALAYYHPQYGTTTIAHVRQMMDDKVITIGRPEIEEGDVLLIDRSEGRYKIQRKTTTTSTKGK